ncbi:MAG: ABC transporter permease, partial [Desulfobaccales bacterium]
MRISEFWVRLWRNRLAISGLALVLGLFAVALLARWLAPYNPDFIDLKQVLMPPSAAHLLGTDTLGRDVLSRIIYGARVSLLVGFVAVGIATLVGVLVGALAGYYGGVLDQILMRLVDLMLCFPTIFLILAVIAVLGPSIWNIMAIIGLTSWMGVARLVRAEFLSLREREFVVAARALGASD